MRHLRSFVALLALTAAAPSLSAQEAPRSPFMFGITVNHVSLNPVAAASQNVGSVAWGMQFDGAYTLGRFFVVSADFAPQRLSDNAGFTQSTTGGDKSSSAMLMYFSAMAGARTTPFTVIPGVAPAALALFGGASATAGERSIDQCVDCTTQTISIGGGTFVQPTLTFGDGRVRVRVSDRYYVGGKGIRSVISLGMEMGGL